MRLRLCRVMSGRHWIAFFKKNPNVSRNPEEWGAGRAEYESSILQDYGNSRAMAVANGKSVAPDRYAHLVAVLGDPS